MNAVLLITDFSIPPYVIPQSKEVALVFATYSKEQQDKVLEKIMGRKFFAAFETGMAQATPLQKWQDLLNGVSYQSNGKTYSWIGIKNLLKPFIYSQWIGATANPNSGIGIVRMDSENALFVNPAYEISRSWNTFNRNVGGCHSVYNTLYGYLFLSGDTYLDDVAPEYDSFVSYLSANFNCPGRKNAFDL